MESCRKKKSDDASFLQEVKDHIDEFVHASMDEHKACFKKILFKMFEMNKAALERKASEFKESDSAWPMLYILPE
ncbi:hypothetical protein R6Q59_033548 [Mikania micrantha]